MRYPILSLLLAVPLGLLSSAAERTIYVATNGNDAWTGRSKVADALSQDGPVASFARALELIRTARADDPAAEIHLTVLPGRHELTAPIVITPSEAGAAKGASLTVSAEPSGAAVLSGGRRISGWKPSPANPNLWQAEIAEVREGNWYFRQLFVNGQRKTRARTPNDGFFRIDGASPQDRPVKLKYRDKDIKREWFQRGDVEVIALLAWADIRMQIRGLDEENRVATLSGNPRPSNKENNARYWIENSPELLDSPGEWYLDKVSGTLTYWPEADEDLRTAEVIAPKLQELLSLKGNLETGQAVANVAFRGLTFSHTDWTLDENGYADTQAAVATRGELLAEAATDCRIEDCRFAHLAGYAIELGRGCKRFQVVGNELYDLGGGGIRIGESARPARAFDENNSHVVTDNHMHRMGRVYPPAVGVFIMQSGGNRIAHNHIHDLYYTAISVGWNWGYRETPCRDNIIEFNHLHDIGQALLSDMGAVYTLGIQKGTRIRNNLVHDVNAFNYGGWGLYTDEGSSDIVLENNLVYRCKNAGFHQHYGRDNIIRNNIFAFNRENQLMRTRQEPHLSFSFTHNIVYFDSGNLLGSNWSNDNYKMDYNVYFDARARDDVSGMKFSGATWEAWRGRGHDEHSLLADPRFIDPDRLDFGLQPDSPAIKLGFQPFDLSSVGVRPKSARTESQRE